MFWKIIAVGITSAIGVLLLEQYILLTREPVAVGEESPTPPEAKITSFVQELEQRFQESWKEK